MKEICFLLLLLGKGLYFYQTPAYKKHRRDDAEYSAYAGPDPQLEQISSAAPGRAGDNADLHQLFFSAGKDFANFFFIISDTKAGVFLQDFVFILSSANSTLAVISASKI